MSNIKYRYDIDGLRAIAVLAVIINHANALWLPGSFVGVDVFFVISGFLISSIIYPQITNKQFTLIQFYQRRIKRLLPALFFMLFAVLLLAWIVFLPDDFEELTRSARYTAFFTSNFFLQIILIILPQRFMKPRWFTLGHWRLKNSFIFFGH